MPWSGAGVFSRIHSWIADKAAAINITASRVDDDSNDFTSGINACLAKNGENTPTANLPMGSFRHTGVGNGVGRADYAAVNQVQDGFLNWVVAGGTADALTATYSPVVSALTDGMIRHVRATAANATTTPTFQPDGLVAHTITKLGGTAVVAGEWGNLQELALRYNLANTRWELLSTRKVAPADVVGTAAVLGANTFTGLQTLQAGATVSGAALTMSAQPINEAFATIASAATVNIGAAAANYLQVTGTTGITAFDTIQAGVERELEFAGILTITHNAISLILLGAGNYTTAAGDVLKFRSEGSGNWRQVNRASASGLPVLKQQKFTTSGTFTTATNTNTNTVYKFTIQGGGANGGSGASGTPCGGAGATVFDWQSGFAAGSAITVTVGAAGAASSISGGGSTTATAGGATAPTGGTASGGTASAILINGATGGANSHIPSVAEIMSPGGSSLFGGGAPQQILGSNSGGVGSNATGFGAGGGAGSPVGPGAGGSGTGGFVLVEWVQ